MPRQTLVYYLPGRASELSYRPAYKVHEQTMNAKRMSASLWCLSCGWTAISNAHLVSAANYFQVVRTPASEIENALVASDESESMYVCSGHQEAVAGIGISVQGR